MKAVSMSNNNNYQNIYDQNPYMNQSMYQYMNPFVNPYISPYINYYMYPYMNHFNPPVPVQAPILVPEQAPVFAQEQETVPEQAPVLAPEQETVPEQAPILGGYKSKSTFNTYKRKRNGDYELERAGKKRKYSKAPCIRNFRTRMCPINRCKNTNCDYAHDYMELNYTMCRHGGNCKNVIFDGKYYYTRKGYYCYYKHPGERLKHFSIRIQN